MPKGQEIPVINGMKFCPGCKQSKPLDEFYANPKSKYGVRSPCKACHRERGRQRYAQDGSSGKQRNAKNIAARYEIKRQLVDMMGGKCSVCGYDKSIYALDFHHSQGDKEGSVTDLIYRAAASSDRQAALQAAMLEAAKCIILCANCHREHHAGIADSRPTQRAAERPHRTRPARR